MKLFCILANQSKSENIAAKLKHSATERDVEFVPIYASDFDFTSAVTATKNDFVYRVGTDEASKLVEHHLLLNSAVKSFYSDSHAGLLKPDNVYQASLIHAKAGLSIIPTIFSCPTDKTLLKKYTEALDGFPLVLKSTGGSHGVGVLKVDSFSSLTSIVDVMNETVRFSNSRLIMRKFIDVKEHARLIVLGSKVISCITYHSQKDDFRTNAGSSLSVSETTCSEEIQRLAVDSVATLGWEYGGVDILIDAEGRPWLAEVNLPCFFVRAQDATNIDISGMMIDYMLQKTLS